MRNKNSLVLFLLLGFFNLCRAQDTISSFNKEYNSELCEKLIIGKWVNIKDKKATINIYKDTLILSEYNKPVKKYIVEKYNCGVSYQEHKGVAPGGNPSLKNWQGYFIQSWNDSGKLEEFWTEAIYSLSNKYLRLGMDGDAIYIRTK